MQLSNRLVLDVVHHQELKRTFADLRVGETGNEERLVEEWIRGTEHELRLPSPTHLVRLQHGDDVTLQTLVAWQPQRLDHVHVQLTILVVEVIRELEFSANFRRRRLRLASVLPREGRSGLAQHARVSTIVPRVGAGGTIRERAGVIAGSDLDGGGADCRGVQVLQGDRAGGIVTVAEEFRQVRTVGGGVEVIGRDRLWARDWSLDLLRHRARNERGDVSLYDYSGGTATDARAGSSVFFSDRANEEDQEQDEDGAY